jgi:hypothetical protein
VHDRWLCTQRQTATFVAAAGLELAFDTAYDTVLSSATSDPRTHYEQPPTSHGHARSLDRSFVILGVWLPG